jgi:NAD-dependent SIR2 family protein deacetylase
MVGFKRFDGVAPNKAHAALALLEQHGKLECLVTQNVDGLHQRAGHANVVDLHGRIDVVTCLGCGARDLPRQAVQLELEANNVAWMAAHLLRRRRSSSDEQSSGNDAPQQRADGDAELSPGADFASFQVPLCPRCGKDGPLKPDVVFFGDSVPQATVARCAAHADAADAVLVVGSSLEVFSAYRLVARHLQAFAELPALPATKASAALATVMVPPAAMPPPATMPATQRAAGLGAAKLPGALRPTKPLCIVNLGETRAERSGAAPLLKVRAPREDWVGR